MVRAGVRVSLGALLLGVLVAVAHAGGTLRIVALRTASSYGDSTFLGFPNGRNLVVDGGSNDTAGVPTDFHWAQQFLDVAVGNGGTLWYMALSHAHADHWNGLDTVMNRYVVMRYYSTFPENDGTAETISTVGYSYFTSLLNTEFSSPYTANANCYEIVATANPATTKKVSGPGTNLGPGWDPSVDALVVTGEELSSDAGPNSNSAGYHVWYGSNTALTCGDTTGLGSGEGDVEAGMVTNYGGAGGRIYQNVQLYKMSHHGSNTSNGASFLSVISPPDPRQRILYVCAGGTGTTDSSNLSGAALDRAKAEQRKRYRPDLDGPMRFAAAGDGEWGFARTYVYPEGGTTSFRSHSVTPPGPPTMPAATVAGVNVNLSWTASTPGTKLLQEYWIFRATVVGGGGIPVEIQPGVDPPASYWRSGSALGIYKRIARVAAPGTTHQDVLAPGSGLFYYRIKASDEYYNESEYSVEFTTDIVAPGSPAGLAVASGGSDGAGAFLNLTWTANTETDLWDYRLWRATSSPVGIGGAFSPAATVMSPGTTHRDRGLGNGTTYYYRLTARDTSLNESGGSSEVSGVYRDSTVPAAPTGLGLADVPADQGNALNLSWAANTEADLKDYRVYRSTNAGVTIGSTWTVHLATIVAPGTTHQDGGLSPGTTSYYRLSARDGVSNESGLSTEISAYPVDNLAPAAPAGLVASNILGGANAGGRLTLTWTASTEADLKDYGVYRATTAGGSGDPPLQRIVVPGTTSQDAGLVNGTTYYYRLKARDGSLNESGYSAEMSAYPTDVTPPSVPSGVVAIDSGTTIENLSWTANTESDLKDYGVYRATYSGAGVGATFLVARLVVPGTTHQDAGLTLGQRYNYRLTARDTSLNESGGSAEVLAVPGPPSAPLGPGVANPGLGLRLSLSWTANTEADVKDYGVYRATWAGASPAPTPARIAIPGTTHQDAGLINEATYYYRLKARDVSLNESGYSAEMSAYPTDVTPPAVPAGLVAVDSGTTIENLSWTANTETDLKDYGVYRATYSGAGVGATFLVARLVVLGTTHQDGGLTLGQRYYYRLTARDATLNESAGSAEVLAVPGPPSAPTGLGAADVPSDLGGALRLSWTAGPEGDLKDYGLFRATWAGASPAPTPTRILSPGTTHQDAALADGATYYYRLSARDTMLNESGLSAEASGSPFSNAAVSPPASQPPPPPPPTVSVSVTIAAAAGGSAHLRTALEPGKETTISGNVLTLASSGVVAGNTIEVKIVQTAARAPGRLNPPQAGEGRPLRPTSPAVELPIIKTLVDAQGSWSTKTPDLADGTYQIQLRQVQGSLASAWAPDPPFSVKVDAVPDALTVVPAGPNPFRPGAGVSLALGFELAETAPVSVTIHAEDGALVATLIDGQTLSAGRYTRSPAGSSAMVWDGRSDLGKPAASGVYVCRIRIGDRLFTRKILLIR